jgi:hypothetical protein
MAQIYGFYLFLGNRALGIKRRDLGGQSVSTVSLPYSQEEVVERFLLTPAELQLAFAWRGETNRCGIALTTPQIDAIIPRFDRRFIGSYRSFPCVTPRGGKAKLLGISKRGDPYLRRLPC